MTESCIHESREISSPLFFCQNIINSLKAWRHTCICILLKRIGVGQGLPILPVKIKWPNDIYANGIKIGGVLCTSTYREKKFNVVVGKSVFTVSSFKFLHCLTNGSLLWLQKLAAGIGLNVGNKKPTTCLDVLLQELVPEAPCYQREELLAAFFFKFEDLSKTFINEGNLRVLERLFLGICLYMLFSFYVLVSLNIQISMHNIWKPVFLYSLHRDCISIWPLPFLYIYQFALHEPQELMCYVLLWKCI